MAFENLSDRERQILRMLIDHYVATAEPVGSRVLANRYPLGLSPATIRNTMQDLEELGLIRQPHTSAGRVPTDDGYRVYVDRLIESHAVPEALQRRLREELAVKHKHAIDEILQQTAHVLASVTSQIGVTLAPRFEQGVISRIELVRVADQRLLVVLGVHSGPVRTILLEVTADIDANAVRETESVLNERLCGQTLGGLKMAAATRLADAGSADARLVRLFVDAAEDLVDRESAGALHIDGASNLFSKPEFADHELLGGIMRVIERREPIVRMLKAHGMGEGLIVSIGREVQLEGAEGCSVISATYQAGQIQGTIGIMGPTRMEYARIVSLVDYIARLLSEQMEA